MRLFRKQKMREWRKAGYETYNVLLSSNDPGANEFAAALETVGVNACVLTNVTKWLEETIAIRATTTDGRKYQARLAIIRGAPTGNQATKVAGALAIAFANNFTPRELKLALQRSMNAAQESPTQQ